MHQHYRVKHHMLLRGALYLAPWGTTSLGWYWFARICDKTRTDTWDDKTSRLHHTGSPTQWFSSTAVSLLCFDVDLARSMSNRGYKSWLVGTDVLLPCVFDASKSPLHSTLWCGMPRGVKLSLGTLFVCLLVFWVVGWCCFQGRMNGALWELCGDRSVQWLSLLMRIACTRIALAFG